MAGRADGRRCVVQDRTRKTVRMSASASRPKRVDSARYQEFQRSRPSATVRVVSYSQFSRQVLTRVRFLCEMDCSSYGPRTCVGLTVHTRAVFKNNSMPHTTREKRARVIHANGIHYTSIEKCQDMESAGKGRFTADGSFRMFPYDPASDRTGGEWKGLHSGEERTILIRKEIDGEECLVEVTIKVLMPGAPMDCSMQLDRGMIAERRN